MRKVMFLFSIICINVAYSQKRFVPKYPPTQEILLKLNTYHSDTIQGIPPYAFNTLSNVNDSVKKKLISLLKHEWSDAEIAVKVDKYFKKNFDYLYFKGILDNSYKIGSTIFANNLDYIINQYRQDSANTFTKYFYKLFDSTFKDNYEKKATIFKKDITVKIKESIVPDEIVLGVSYARILEALPIIKGEITTSNHFYNKEVAELALAGLGDTLYQRKYIDKHKRVISSDWKLNDLFKDFEALSLIKTQESVSLFADFMDTSKIYRPFAHTNNNTQYYSSWQFVSRIFSVIKNDDLWDKFLLQPRNSNYEFEPETATKEQILFLKEWLIRNKGKYQFW